MESPRPTDPFDDVGLLAVSAALGSLPRIPAPPGFAARVRAAIQEEQARMIAAARAPSGFWRAAAAAAAVLLAVGIGILAARPGGGGPAPVAARSESPLPSDPAVALGNPGTEFEPEVPPEDEKPGSISRETRRGTEAPRAGEPLGGPDVAPEPAAPAPPPMAPTAPMAPARGIASAMEGQAAQGEAPDDEWVLAGPSAARARRAAVPESLTEIVIAQGGTIFQQGRAFDVWIDPEERDTLQRTLADCGFVVSRPVAAGSGVGGGYAHGIERSIGADSSATAGAPPEAKAPPRGDGGGAGENRPAAPRPKRVQAAGARKTVLIRLRIAD